MIEATHRQSSYVARAPRYERMIGHARRALTAFDYDSSTMTNAEVEATCVALVAWTTQAIQSARAIDASADLAVQHSDTNADPEQWSASQTPG